MPRFLSKLRAVSTQQRHRVFRGSGARFLSVGYSIRPAADTEDVDRGEEKVMDKLEKGQSQHLPTLDVPLEGMPDLVPASDLKAPETEMTTLSNGLRVVSQETYGQCTTVALLVNAGSRFEADAAQQGSTHVMEAMAFKSTTNRSHAEVVREFEDLGVFPSCVSAREEILYTIDVMRDRVESAVEIFADAVCNPLFDESEVSEAKEIMGYILEDIYSESPAQLVTEELVCAAFGRDTPVGRPMMCDFESLPGVSPEGLKGFVDAHFSAENMILSVAGLEHKDAVAIAEKYFGAVPRNSSVPGIEGVRASQLQPGSYVGGQTLKSVENLPFTHVALAFDAGGWHGDDLVPVCVLHSLLGGGDSFSAGGPGKGMYSRLYRQVLNQYAWVESILGTSVMHGDCGITGMVGSSEGHFSANMLAVMCYQLKALATNPVEHIELSRARNRLKSSVLMSLESRMLLAEDMARQVATYGFRESPGLLMERIEKVTAEDLVRVANRAINSKPTIVAYGDISKIPPNVSELVEATLQADA